MWGPVVPGLHQHSEAACHVTRQMLTVTGHFSYGRLLKTMQERYTQQPGKSSLCVVACSAKYLPSVSCVQAFRGHLQKTSEVVMQILCHMCS